MNLLGNKTPVTWVAPGEIPELNRMPPGAQRGSTMRLLLMLGAALLLVAGIVYGVYTLWKGGDRNANTVSATTLTLVPTRTIAPSATPTSTPDAWGRTGTALVLDALNPTATPTTTMDYCWFLTPTATATNTALYTPDAWGATGTAVWFLTNTPTPSDQTPTSAPPRAWCNDIYTPTLTPFPLRRARTATSESTEEVVFPTMRPPDTPTSTSTILPIIINTPPPQAQPPVVPPVQPQAQPTSQPPPQNTIIVIVTATYTYTHTPTVTATNTATHTATDTPTETATNTETPTDTATATETPTDTASPTDTETPTETATATETATDTPTPTDTASPTATGTPLIAIINGNCNPVPVFAVTNYGSAPGLVEWIIWYGDVIAANGAWDALALPQWAYVSVTAPRLGDGDYTLQIIGWDDQPPAPYTVTCAP